MDKNSIEINLKVVSKYLKMKKSLILLLTLLLINQLAICQTPNSTFEKIDKYINEIRNNESRLRQFLAEFPKGGDLHHHYSGSVYAETYLKYIEEQDLYINTRTFDVADSKRNPRAEWSKVSSIKSDGYWQDVRVKIIESWSKLYFSYLSNPSDEHFFSTFGKFEIAKNGTFNEGLKELKRRAISENVSYIETMFKSTGFFDPFDKDKEYNRRLLNLQKNKDSLTHAILTSLHDYYISVEDSVLVSKSKKHNKFIEMLHKNNKIDDQFFTMRYQNYFIRVLDPITTFKSFLLAFYSANTSDLIVGVNIVAPENNPTSMKDYWLHMQIFKFLKEMYPHVKTAMHAGELTLGLVKPEDLKYHIHQAIFIANANRIGHGVDIAYEKNSEKILEHMASNKIAIEINLTSNDFILGVNKTQHPLLLYRDFNVPIVISTDDAGVLRTDLTEQYLILLKDYPSISYGDIKQFAFNSITFSFIENDIKKELLRNLEKRFVEFESKFANHSEKKIASKDTIKN